MKQTLLTLITAVVVLLAAQVSLASDKEGLSIDVYNADSGSFGVVATLIYGETEAILVDTGFTKADALRIVAKILDSKKTLTTIFISQADPDYYFGAEVIHTFFPDVKIITTPAVKAVIEEKLENKLAVWAPRMGANAPRSPKIPTAYDKSSLSVDGQLIEIRGTEGVLAHRPYLWIPESKTIAGNVAVFGNIHPWLADAQSSKMQEAWKKQLRSMLDLKPLRVIPGHMLPGTSQTSDAIRFTLNYISDFQKQKKSSANSAELIQAMSAIYPNAQGELNLSIAAKVHKGEMKW